MIHATLLVKKIIFQAAQWPLVFSSGFSQDVLLYATSRHALGIENMQLFLKHVKFLAGF